MRIEVVNHIFAFARLCVKAVVAVLLAMQARFAIEALAGKTTVADVVVGYFTDSPSGLTIGFSMALALICTIWAINERRLRRRLLLHQQSRLTRLEERVDPDRGSSDLMSDGTTRPEDR